MKYDKHQLLVLGIGVLLIGGFSVVRFIPIMQQKYRAVKAINAEKKVIEQVRSHRIMIPGLKHQEAKLNEKLTPYITKIPESRNFAQLWQQIADVMKKCELSEQFVQPGVELRSDRLCSIPFTLECSGTLNQIYKFLQEMEDFERLVRIEEATLENNPDLKGRVKLIAKANVYYQPEKTNNG